MDNAIRTTSTEIHRSAGILTGLLLGGVTGMGVMMLLAPRSGKKTRAQMRLKSSELQDQAVDVFDDLVTLSRFDNRKILAGTRKETEHR